MFLPVDNGRILGTGISNRGRLYGPAPLFFSDVVIISMGKECFPADLGVTGIKKWLNAH
jgi:hypothetical protein